MRIKKGKVYKRAPINVPGVFILLDSLFHFKFMLETGEGWEKERETVK